MTYTDGVQPHGLEAALVHRHEHTYVMPGLVSSDFESSFVPRRPTYELESP